MIKVAYIGDSPFINSGFGIVARAILSRLPRDEFSVSVLGTMHQFTPLDTSIFDYYQSVCIHDLMGFKTSIDFVQHVSPEVIFFIGDPGTLRNRFEMLMMSGRVRVLPSVTYFPLEGKPFNPHILEQARFPHAPVTYTKWGQGEMAEHGIEVDYVYHGTDHGNFVQVPRNIKLRLKKIVGWGDKFVVGMVGVNKRSNRQPALIEAARILKDRGRDDILIYLHTQERGEMFMGGWELGWMIEAYGVQDMVVLKPNQGEHKYIGRPQDGTMDAVITRQLPKDDAEARANLGDLDFISLLNTFDLYVDPASAHGFNLPLIEAARCGVPGVTVDDGFARTEIYSGSAYLMKPSAHDYWHTGAWLPLVSPEKIANAIEEMADDNELRSDVASRCKTLANSLTWDTAATMFADKIRGAYEFGQEYMREKDS